MAWRNEKKKRRKIYRVQVDQLDQVEEVSIDSQGRIEIAWRTWKQIETLNNVRQWGRNSINAMVRGDITINILRIEKQDMLNERLINRKTLSGCRSRSSVTPDKQFKSKKVFLSNTA